MTIEELFDLVLPRLESKPSCSVFEAVRAVQKVIVNRLLLKRSDLVQENLLLDYYAGADNNIVILPDGFHATSELPYISGTGKLLPLEGGADKSQPYYSTAATPARYEIKGRQMTIYPPALVAGNVVVPAFVRPSVPTEMTDELPFYGAFDEAFVDGALYVLKEGTSAVSNENFVALITTQVDQVLSAKDLSDEQAVADAINWGR